MPDSKDKLTSSESQKEKKFLNFFRRKTGTPNGPVDFLMLRSSINLSTSMGPEGER